MLWKPWVFLKKKPELTNVFTLSSFGARNFARARQFLGLALGMVFGIGLMLYALFALFPEMLL